MVVTLATFSFLLPVGHPSNVLIIGPGGCRLADYARVEIPPHLAGGGIAGNAPLLAPFPIEQGNLAN